MEPTLSIGDVAVRSGVATSALRYYERLGMIRSTRTSGNQRRYRRSELRRVAFIRISAQLGVPLDEIRKALAALPDGRTPTKADWARLSAAWRELLEQRIALLERLRDDLTGCIGCGCLSLRECRLYNRDDRLASRGPGAHYLIGDVRKDEVTAA